MKKIISLLLATVTAISLVGCGSTPTIVRPDSDGFAEGKMGDTMRTYFFDYTVNSAYLCDEYAGYTAAEGNELLVADVTVKNTGSSELKCMTPTFKFSGTTTLTMHSTSLSPSIQRTVKD